jgi:excisionase family DNA binding protein
MRRIDVSQAARLLGISSFTLACWARGKRVPHYRVGGRVWFDRDELKQWIRARHVPVVADGDKKDTTHHD